MAMTEIAAGMADEMETIVAAETMTETVAETAAKAVGTTKDVSYVVGQAAGLPSIWLRSIYRLDLPTGDRV
jgi:ABC-type xylose transport system substrate-binding protein